VRVASELPRLPRLQRITRLIFAAFLGLCLSGCGDTTGERAATVGLIGGTAGLAVGAPLAGAAVGAGAGAVTDEN
jgi:hypothetical protein